MIEEAKRSLVCLFHEPFPDSFTKGVSGVSTLLGLYFSVCPPYLFPTHIISTAEPGNTADLLALYASSFYIQNDYWLGLNDPCASEMYLILGTIWNILEHSVLVARLFLLIIINLNFVESMGFLSTCLIMMKYIVLGVKIFLYTLDYENAYFKENMMSNQS